MMSWMIQSHHDYEMEDFDSDPEYGSVQIQSVGMILRQPTTNSLAHIVLMGILLSLHFSSFVFWKKPMSFLSSCFSKH